MKKELLWAACVSAALGMGVLMLTGGSEPEGLPWTPLNEKLETALAAQEGTLEQHEEGKTAKAAGTVKEKSKADKAKESKQPSGQNQAAEAASGATQETSNSCGEALKRTGSTGETGQTSADYREVESVGIPPQAPASQTSTESQSVEVGKVHLNTADATQLMELPGIGQKKAQAILDYRAKNGPFREVADLVKVKGIGPKMLEKMLPDLAL
ncbi:hypothetical protein B9G55_00735 [Saccharibacillus sp. O16]|nr:hypothetical protein B9G55_00735 [Saccharibacillus sp. O16]